MKINPNAIPTYINHNMIFPSNISNAKGLRYIIYFMHYTSRRHEFHENQVNKFLVKIF